MQFEFSLPWQGGFRCCLLAVLCLSLSLPYFNLLHHFTTTTGLKEEEATARLGTDSVGDEDRRRRRQGREEPAKVNQQRHQDSQECSRESGKDSIIIINIRAKSHTLVKSVSCLKHNNCPRAHFSSTSPRINR